MYLEILSRLSYSSIYCLALRNSFFSLAACPRLSLSCCSSIFRFASDRSLAILILFFSWSSPSFFSSCDLFFLIASWSSLAFYIFSSLVRLLIGLWLPSPLPTIFNSSLKSASSECWSIHSRAFSVEPPWSRVKKSAFSDLKLVWQRELGPSIVPLPLK